MKRPRNLFFKKKLFLTLMCLFSVLFFSSTASAFYEIDLSQGWNLISLPEQPTNARVEVVTTSIEGKFISIWTYADGQWDVYDSTSPGFNTLSNLDAGKAYWINMSQAGTLVGDGLKSSSTILLESGWNFIGFNSMESMDVGEVVDSAGEAVSSVWTMVDGRWHFYDATNPSSGFNNLSTMEPGQGYWFKVTSNSMLSIGVSIPDTTITVDENTANFILEITDDHIIFQGSSTFLSSLSVGDIISSPPIDEAPNGFLRKIVSISTSGNLTTVVTETASLTEAIENGTAGIHKAATLDPSWIASLDANSGITLLDVDTNNPEAISHTIALNCDVDLEDGKKFTIQGELTFSSDFLIHLEMDNWQTKDFYCTYTGQVDSNIKFAGSQEIELFNMEKDLDSVLPVLPIRFTPIVVWAGWVPIVFTPELTVVVGADGTIGVELSAKVGARASATLGVGYRNTDGWRIINETNFDFYTDPGIALTYSFKSWMGPKVNVFVYGLGGPYILIRGYGKFSGSIPIHDASIHDASIQDASIQDGLEFWVGAELKLGVEANNQLGFSGGYEFPVTVGAEVKLYPPDVATVTGHVFDDAGGVPGATVTIVKGSYELSTVTNEDGDYSFAELSPGFYSRLYVSKPGYLTANYYDFTLQGGVNFSVQDLYLNIINFPGGVVSGRITNAINGNSVPYASITFRPGINNYTFGFVEYTTTDIGGNYSVSGLDAGYYTCELNKPGFIGGFFTVLCLAGVDKPNQNGVLSPVVDASEIRIVLTWGTSPSDLDSHLTGPLAGSTSRFHIYYASRGSLTSSPFAHLDHDDVTSYGPETTTITEVSGGIYRYSVHNYSNRSSSSSSVLANSGAQVAVYRGNNLWKTYTVPNQPGTLWTVFEYDKSTMVEPNLINTMSYHASPSSVQSTNLHSDADLLENLPEK